MFEVLRHQDLDGVLATVVRYFGGVKLGAGGLVRAYTDSVAQALLSAQKMPIIRQRHLRCAAPYPLEGTIRRELDASGAVLDAVVHADAVTFAFHLPIDTAAALVARLNETGNGRIAWMREPENTDAPADSP
jgi:putative IMPACT (imprinted ancient) family translation regulator